MIREIFFFFSVSLLIFFNRVFYIDIDVPAVNNNKTIHVLLCKKKFTCLTK